PDAQLIGVWAIKLSYRDRRRRGLATTPLRFALTFTSIRSQVHKGTFTLELSSMLGTQKKRAAEAALYTQRGADRLESGPSSVRLLIGRQSDQTLRVWPRLSYRSKRPTTRWCRTSR